MKKWIRKALESLLPRKEARKAPRRPLMAARPASLEQNYLLADDGPVPDEAFYRLRGELYRSINAAGEKTHSGQTIFKESGQLPGGRPYFFLKPADERGYLFERTGSGWAISRAEKIVERGLFLRDYEVLDKVNLYYPRDGRAYPRVKSVQPKSELLSFAVYEQRLKQSLGLSSEARGS